MFGQVVIGPPGSGKTTYCTAMKEFLFKLGRTVAIINLDPANEHLPYDCSIDLSELITLEEVMAQLGLGPNGGLLYCMEYLVSNLDWLDTKIASLPNNSYLLIDFPGQIELYTQQASMTTLIRHLTCSPRDHRLCAVHLVDSHHCADPGKFVSVLVTALSGMLALALPHVNILSKADLIDKDGNLPFNVDYFTDVLDLGYLLEQLNDDPLFKKYRKFNEALVGIIEDHSLINFLLLDIQDQKCMLNVQRQVDKANGYVFGSGEERSLQNLLSSAMGSDFSTDVLSMVQDKYVSSTKTPLDSDTTSNRMDIDEEDQNIDLLL